MSGVIETLRRYSLEPVSKLSGPIATGIVDYAGSRCSLEGSKLSSRGETPEALGYALANGPKGARP
jgi:hypothetical protein